MLASLPTIVFALAVTSAALDPRAQALLERADAALKTDDAIAALHDYVEAVRIDPQAATREALDRYRPPIYGRGKSPDIEAAQTAFVAALRQYLDLHPKDFVVLREWVTLTTPADAETLLTSMMRSSPAEAELYALRGTARAKAGRPDDSLADFVKSAELDPSNPERHYALGVVLYEMTKDAPKKDLVQRGIASLERAEALREGYFESMMYRSLLLRTAASLETDPARQNELTQKADAVRAEAVKLIAARRAAATPPHP